MSWEITQTKRCWTATDAERGIELSSPTREALDQMIAKVEASRIPTPRKQAWEMTDDELKDYHKTALVNHETVTEAVRYWTGRGPAPVAPQQDTIQARFEEFHRANPHIYVRLVEAARRLKQEGKTKIGIGHLVEEVIRWSEERTFTGENYKISNDYRSRYARKIMEEESDLAGMFEVRPLESA